MTRTRNAALAVVLAVATLAVVAAVGPTAATPHGSTEDGQPTNFTWVPATQSDHQPGKSDASYNSFSTTEKEGNLTLEYIIVESADIDMSGCSAFNARALGIDRGNDDAGTQTDESLVDHLESNEFRKDKIVLKFYGQDSLGGQPVTLTDQDEIVSASSNCFVNPSEPGWYQAYGKINGTEPDGSSDKIDVMSHYFYVCDCDSRQQAVNKLGPPPSQEGEGGGSNDGGGGGGSTATATATSTSGGGGGGGGGSTATATPTSGGGGSTASATATPGSSGGGSTPAPTATGNASTNASTNASSNASTNGSSNASASTSNGSANASTGGSGGAGDSGNTGGSNVSGTTPTSSGSGPGFGLVAAVGALAAAALLVFRRD